MSWTEVHAAAIINDPPAVLVFRRVRELELNSDASIAEHIRIDASPDVPC